ncbi:MAG: type III PLP-dependent enzyme [Pseudomonadota bacterium]|nr:type III PLP-dependent enzyme [Pseudomonadota bacterium]
MPGIAAVPGPVVAGSRIFDAQQDPFAHRSIAQLVKRYGSPLFIIDAQRIRARYRRLSRALPKVDLHYALKPLPHPAVIAALREEGAFFDLASSGEVALAQRCRVDPRRCIHTHPIKRDSDIRTALAFGIDLFVVDNPDEMRKFAKYRNAASVLVRVAFHSPDAVCDLSKKFGCSPQAVAGLLALATELRIVVKGLSFHVGSQTSDPRMCAHAIGVCRQLMQSAAAAGHSLDLLDIGGGFPVDPALSAPPIEDYCAPIRASLSSLRADVRVIAEPGRYVAAPAAIGVASVMGRAERGGKWWYYLDDGLYGTYSGQMYDHASYAIDTVTQGDIRYPSVLAGPTCDSIDVIADDISLPKLKSGDLIVGRDMGAYTWASASEFNFFPRATVVALDGGRIMHDGSDE